MLPKDYSLTLADWDHYHDIYNLTVRFLKEDTPYRSIDIDPETIKRTIEGYFVHSTDSIGIVLLHDSIPVGFVAGRVELSPFSKSRIAVELVWSVHPDHRNSRGGLELFKAYEHWAEHVAEADIIHLSSVHNETSARVAKMYEKKGYTPAEKTFVKFLRKP